MIKYIIKYILNNNNNNKNNKTKMFNELNNTEYENEDGNDNFIIYKKRKFSRADIAIKTLSFVGLLASLSCLFYMTYVVSNANVLISHAKYIIDDSVKYTAKYSVLAPSNITEIGIYMEKLADIINFICNDLAHCKIKS